jgi:hypothetical protein
MVRTTTAGVSTVFEMDTGLVIDSHTIFGNNQDGALIKLNTDTKSVEILNKASNDSSGARAKIQLLGVDNKLYFSEGDILKSYDLTTGTISVIDFSVLCPEDLGCIKGLGKVMTNYGAKVLAVWGQRLVDVTQSPVTEFAPADYSVGTVISDTKIVLAKWEWLDANRVTKLFLRDDVAGTTTELVLSQPIKAIDQMIYLAGTNEILFTGSLVSGQDCLGKLNLTTETNVVTATSGYSDIQSLSK